MKQLSLAVAIIGLLIRVYFVYSQQAIHSARQVLPGGQTLSQLRRDAQAPDAEADAAARGTNPPPKPAVAAPAAAPVAAASDTARAEIEAALRAMHLTTLMPGQPGLVIIDKHEFAEGEDVPLPKGRKAHVAAVQDDGVRLTCEGMAFRLDPPAGPDLAALRKKR